MKCEKSFKRSIATMRAIQLLGQGRSMETALAEKRRIMRMTLAEIREEAKQRAAQ